MKVIDERGKEKTWHEPVATKEVEEQDERLIQIYPDWRMGNELRILTEDHERWINGQPAGRTLFLETAIKNRDTLESLYVMDYDHKETRRINRNFTALTCRVDDETLAELKRDARAAGLGFDEYMRALAYSYAKKLRDEKISKDIEEEARRVANRPTHFDIALSKPLQATLLAKYPLTEQEESNTHIDGFFRYVYMKERLMMIIEEALED